MVLGAPALPSVPRGTAYVVSIPWCMGLNAGTQYGDGCPKCLLPMVRPRPHHVLEDGMQPSMESAMDYGLAHPWILCLPSDTSRVPKEYDIQGKVLTQEGSDWAISLPPVPGAGGGSRQGSFPVGRREGPQPRAFNLRLEREGRRAGSLQWAPRMVAEAGVL